jgi:SAM-dependent methyltransferase
VKRVLLWSGGLAILLVALLVILHFPYATDAEPSREEVARTIAFYQRAYAAPNEAPNPNEATYVKVAEAAAQAWRIKDRLSEFVSEQHLKNKKVLEVGAGRGYLQDLVDDYTGLDISPTAKRFFTKPFVLGSATALPFRDNQVDAVWSIWVVEHVPNPEQAFREMRRVVKDGGLLYLFPAWDCPPWAAQGYAVRPYSDFGVKGKLVKASIPLREANLFRAAYTAPIRLLRLLFFRLVGSPTRLHYRRLTPNYEKYWTGDSDAVSSIDRYEALLWFASRGDECLNCSSASLLRAIAEHVTDPRLIIRVRKR